MDTSVFWVSWTWNKTICVEACFYSPKTVLTVYPKTTMSDGKVRNLEGEESTARTVRLWSWHFSKLVKKLFFCQDRALLLWVLFRFTGELFVLPALLSIWILSNCVYCLPSLQSCCRLTHSLFVHYLLSHSPNRKWLSLCLRLIKSQKSKGNPLDVFSRQQFNSLQLTLQPESDPCYHLGKQRHLGRKPF